jgi:hypothetical protein
MPVFVYVRRKVKNRRCKFKEGRAKNQETVLSPSTRVIKEREDVQALPGEPPKIWGAIE